MNDTPSSSSSASSKVMVCVGYNESSKLALYYGCLKAKKLGGGLEVMHVITPADFQGLQSVAEKIRKDTKAQAEVMLQDMAAYAREKTGIVPNLLLREGQIGEEIVKAVEGDNNIAMLVVAAAEHDSGHAEVIGWLADRLVSDLLIPMIVLPGNLTDQQIEEIC